MSPLVCRGFFSLFTHSKQIRASSNSRKIHQVETRSFWRWTWCPLPLLRRCLKYFQINIRTWRHRRKWELTDSQIWKRNDCWWKFTEIHTVWIHFIPWQCCDFLTSQNITFVLPEDLNEKIWKSNQTKLSCSPAANQSLSWISDGLIRSLLASDVTPLLKFFMSFWIQFYVPALLFSIILHPTFFKHQWLYLHLYLSTHTPTGRAYFLINEWTNLRQLNMGTKPPYTTKTIFKKYP